jgi:hypothetical protein
VENTERIYQKSRRFPDRYLQEEMVPLHMCAIISPAAILSEAHPSWSLFSGVSLVSALKGSFFALGGRAAAGIATQSFGGGTGRIDLDAPPVQQAQGKLFPCQDEKCPHSDSETASVSSRTSGWTLAYAQGAIKALFGRKMA